MPSTLQHAAVDEAKAMPSVFGHHKVVILEVSDCERTYEGRVSDHRCGLL